MLNEYRALLKQRGLQANMLLGAIGQQEDYMRNTLSFSDPRKSHIHIDYTHTHKLNTKEPCSHTHTHTETKHEWTMFTHTHTHTHKLNTKEPCSHTHTHTKHERTMFTHITHTWTSRVIGPLLSISSISPFLVPTRICPCPRVMARMEGLSSSSSPAQKTGSSQSALSSVRCCTSSGHISKISSLTKRGQHFIRRKNL